MILSINSHVFVLGGVDYQIFLALASFPGRVILPSSV